MAPLQRDMYHVQSLTSAHAARLEDMENRLRRNNVWAVGIPEKTEGKNPVAFIEKWLINAFGRESFSPMFSVERALRVLSKPPRPGEPPQLLMFKLLNLKDRDASLYQARMKSEAMKIDNVCILFYPDFSADVQRSRAKFTEVKKCLWRFEVTYAMLYPAPLRVVANHETNFFDNSASASNWLERVEHTLVKATPSSVFSLMACFSLQCFLLGSTLFHIFTCCR